MFLRNNIAKKASPIKKVMIGLLALYVFAALLFSFVFVFYNLASGLIPLDLGWVYFANVGIMSVMMSVMFTIFTSQSMLFEAKDNQLLLSLPIKPSQILGSRLLVLGVLEYLSSLLILLPAGAVYVYLANPPVMFYIVFLLATILLPLLGLAIASFFGYIVSSVTSRMRNKSLFVTFFSLLFVGGYLWGYTSLTSGVATLVANGQSIGEAIKNMLPPFYYLGTAMVHIDVVSLVYFALWCLTPFALIYMWLSKSFISLATANRQAKKLVYKESAAQRNSVFSALLNKEMKKFVGTPMYLLNCGISYLMAIGFGVYFFIKGPDMLGAIFSNMPEVSSYIVPAVTVVLCFLAGMSFTTAPSISLEGKNLWILRSMPIKVGDIFNAKIALNLIFGFIALVFAGICVIYRIAPTVVDALLIVLIPLSVQVFTAIAGLICNLFFPKFDAVNDTIVIKQSASVIVAMLVSFALVILMIVAYVASLSVNMPFALLGLSVIIVINVLNVVAYRFIMTKGVKMFNTF